MKRLSIALMAFLVASGLAWAHSDEYLDTVATPHGGQLRMAGQFHLELVAKPGELTVYVTDHGDTPQETEGATATALVTTGKKQTTVTLQPAGENVFKGSGKFRLTRASTVKVTVQFPEDEPQIAKFTPLRKRAVTKPAAPAPAPHHETPHHE